MRPLKARERELQFELFQAKLTAEDLGRLEHDARVHVNPKLGLSVQRQLEVHKDTILQQWFTQRSAPAPRDASGSGRHADPLGSARA